MTNASSSIVGDDAAATGSSSGRDRLGIAALLGGFALLAGVLLGGFFQKPPLEPKPLAASWLLQPQEQNAFAKFPTIGTGLWRVYFAGPLRGWAFGSGGTIVATSDGGQTWQPQSSGATNSLFSVCGTGDGKRLWAVGDRGTILHSTDGATWQRQTSGATNGLRSVYGAGDGKTLWAVGLGGAILHSTDGVTWQRQTSGTLYDLNSVYGAGDGKTLWAVGQFGTILHSTDGATWQPQTSGTTNDLRWVYGLGDGKTLWVVGGDGTILHSTDGATWQPQASRATNSLFSVYGTGDGKTLWAVGDGGTILHSTDGATWQPQTSGAANDLYSVYGTGDGKTLWVVGRGGTILHSTDGATWQPQASGATNSLFSVYGLGDGKTLWVVGGDGTILHTTDGATWQPQTSAVTSYLTSVYGTGDRKTLWAVGFDGMILHSTDGATWQRQASGTRYDLASVYGTGDGKAVWAVGDGGTILHSTDGATWKPQTSGTTNILGSVYGTGDGKTLWAVGYRGMILHSTDGATWQLQASGTTNHLLSVYAAGDGKTVWAVGFGGTILHCTDGATWQPQASGTTNNLYSVYGTGDGKAVWAVGDGGAILHSADGVTWQPQISGTTNPLLSVYGPGDGKTLWAVGLAGTILTTQDGGTTWTNVRYSYRPARWVWLMVALAGTLLLVGIVRLQRPVVAPKQSIENSALSDQPATKLEQDLLDATETVLALAEFLRNRNTEPPVTLSVEGSWGTGKTSVMRMLESELRRASVPTVWFNAWHNEGEEQMLAFLLESIRQQAFPRWWDPREIPFRLRLLALRFERWPVMLLLLVAATLFLLHPALDWLRGLDTENVKRLHDLVAWLDDCNWAQLVTIGSAVAAAIPLTRKLLRLATGISAQPSDLLSESDSKSGNAARTSFRTRFAREFEEASRALGPGRRITIFIDDLDRCQPEQVRQTLEAVNFLVSSAGCFVVMGIARSVVEASVGLGFKEIAEELAPTDDPSPQGAANAGSESDRDRELAAKRRRRDFAAKYLQKLINFTVMLRPYSGDALSKVATSNVRVSVRPPLVRQAVPYALAASAVLATVLLWSVAKLPVAPPLANTLPAERFRLPGTLKEEQLKSLVIERDASGKFLGEKRTYDTDQKPSGPPAPLKEGNGPVIASKGEEGARLSAGDGFQAGQTYSPRLWLWWMVPLLIASACLAIQAILVSRQRVIRDSPDFRKALLLWRVVYENRIRTPREIKRFVNELRYKAIRFRGPQAAVRVLGSSAEDESTGASPHEPTLILFAILDRLLQDANPGAARERLTGQDLKTFNEHVRLFGEPSDDDWERYHRLFDEGTTGR